MTYLVLIQEDGWVLAREDLIRALRSDWPASEVSGDTGGDPAADVAWTHGIGQGRIEGSAHESGQCIYLEGQELPVAEFVSWYRGLVPAGVTVVFCDDTYSFDAVVPPGSDANQVLSLLED